MVFSTTLFVFLFLPLFLAGYYALPRRARLAWLLGTSWVFYGWWRLDFLGLLVAASVWTWLLGRRIAGMRAGPAGAPAGSAVLVAAGGGPAAAQPAARLALAVGVGLNLAVLGYFKYFNFGVDSLNALLGLLGGAPLAAGRVILPAGISFYVFQAISYLVDVYRGDAPAARRLSSLSTYLALFPQLIAGPILRYKDLAGQLLQRSHSFELFGGGAVRFMAGFCKKVLVADTVAPLADAAFSLSRPSLADAWLGVLAYSAQIYFDFSGYSDMAIGLGRMIGFRFMENFDRPYRSRSITEFWRRWHISLSTWLRDYLYIPLGGNRRGAGRTYLNLLTVMLFGGLWHGASWTFVLWGLWHGLLLAAERLRPAAGPRLPVPLGVASTLLAVMAGWVLFRAPDLAGAAAMYAGMLGLHGAAVSDAFAWRIGGPALAALAAAVAIVAAPAGALRRPAPAGAAGSPAGAAAPLRPPAAPPASSGGAACRRPRPAAGFSPRRGAAPLPPCCSWSPSSCWGC